MLVNQPFIPFIYHIWGETVLWGTVFIIQTSDRMQYFTILQYKLYSFNIQDDRSRRGLLAKPFKKFPKHLWSFRSCVGNWGEFQIWNLCNFMTTSPQNHINSYFFFTISVIFLKMGKHSDFLLSSFQVVEAWRILQFKRKTEKFWRVYMVLGDAVTKL